MKFCQYVASLQPHVFTNFGRFILIFNKMVLIFVGALIVFIASNFRLLPSQIALTLSPIMFGPNSSDLDLLDYHVWGQCWSFITSCNQRQNSSRVQKCTSVDLVCLTGESNWQLWQIKVRENDSLMFSLVACSYYAERYRCFSLFVSVCVSVVCRSLSSERQRLNYEASI